MRARILAVMILVFQAASVYGAGLQKEDTPWLGVWRLDDARSTLRGENPYKRTTLRIEAIDSRVRVVYDMVGVRGGRYHIEWLGAFDGQDHPVQGVDPVMTNAYSLIDADSYQIVVKVDGQVAAVTRVSVSSDRQTLTAITTQTDAGGETVTTTSVYRRL